MNEPHEPQADCPPPVATLLADQREHWEQGERVLVEVYLRRHPALHADPEALLDLVYNEVFLRERRGEQPHLSEYLRRFPHLAGPLRLQFDVHQSLEKGALPEADSKLPVVPGYTLLAEIGRGGMARVYKARDEARNRLVAIKTLLADRFGTRANRKRFVIEAHALAALQHPHIVKVHDVGECMTGPYLVMDLVEGTSLEAVRQCGPSAVSQVVAWLIPVAEAVHHAHGQGIIHRDLKPANILLKDEGGATPLPDSRPDSTFTLHRSTYRPMIADFGLAKVLSRSGLTGISSTQQGTILGTPGYMPPEQAGEYRVEPGPYSDVYSLGAVLYALLTGHPPYDEGTFLMTLLKVRSPEPPPAVRSLRPEVPEVLARICAKCLNKRPPDRFDSALALANALRQAVPSPLREPAPISVQLIAVATGEVFRLEKATTLLGRAADCDVVLNAPAVSRRHCRILCTENQVLVVDLGSTRGTRLNGQVIASAPLQDGDQLELARKAFQVRVQRADH